MNTHDPSAIDLYWLPLGAGGHSVRLNGKVFEWFAARREHRDRCDLYHSALQVYVPEGRFVIEQGELIGEAQFRLAPLTGLDAEQLVRSGKAGRLVAGFRGAPAADETALVDLLLRLSLLVDELPEVVELDLNPVLALPTGCLAVDARVRLADRVEARRTKSW